MSDSPQELASNDDAPLPVVYRNVTPTDILQCHELEKASYPKEEAASKNTLQYRQHHAAPYFRCAILKAEREICHAGGEDHHHHHDDDHEDDMIVGYICSTRCHSFEDQEAMYNHSSDGPLLAIHSVVTHPDYRRKGLASAMMTNYLEEIKAREEEYDIHKVVLIAKAPLLTFYVDCGFRVMRPSPIVYGADKWYELEYPLLSLTCEEELLTMPPSLGAVAGFPCFLVDSFAGHNLGTGNPAAVVLLPKRFKPQQRHKWCQLVAAEFNLSETAFVWPRDQTPFLSKVSHWNIRYYTPKMQVELCGHATLASAAILYGRKVKEDAKIIFHALEEELIMQIATDGSDAALTLPSTSDSSSIEAPPSSGYSTPPIQNQQPLQSQQNRRTKISMTFPAKPPQEIVGDDLSVIQKMLQSAFSVPIDEGVLYMGLSDIGDVLIELTPQAFDGIGYEQLNYGALLEWDGYYRGVIICCLPGPDAAESGGVTSITPPQSPSRVPSTNSMKQLERCQSVTSDHSEGEVTSISASVDPADTVDFLSRFFGPKAGIDEDPVTGSAHCVLAPYFSKRLGGKTRVIGKQASERGGIVECWINSGESDGTITLVGTAVTTMNGTLWM